MAASYNRNQIRAALAQNDPALSLYLDLASGEVIEIDDSANSSTSDDLRNQVMDGYGDRFRYIPGGNADADDAAIAAWLEAEGL